MFQIFENVFGQSKLVPLYHSCTGGWTRIQSITCMQVFLANVKKLSQAALAGDMPEPRTLIGAWKEMLEIRREQIKNPNY